MKGRKEGGGGGGNGGWSKGGRGNGEACAGWWDPAPGSRMHPAAHTGPGGSHCAGGRDPAPGSRMHPVAMQQRVPVSWNFALATLGSHGSPVQGEGHPCKGVRS